MGCGAAKHEPSTPVIKSDDPSRKKYAKPDEEEEHLETAFLCEKGHKLVVSRYAEDEYKSGFFTCRICNAGGQCNKGRFFCDTCRNIHL